MKHGLRKKPIMEPLWGHIWGGVVDLSAEQETTLARGWRGVQVNHRVCTDESDAGADGHVCFHVSSRVWATLPIGKSVQFLRLDVHVIQT